MIILRQKEFVQLSNSKVTNKIKSGIQNIRQGGKVARNKARQGRLEKIVHEKNAVLSEHASLTDSPYKYVRQNEGLPTWKELGSKQAEIKKIKSSDAYKKAQEARRKAWEDLRYQYEVGF